MVCHRCQTEAVKFGINAQGFQRYRCKQCSRTFSDIPARPLDDLRVDPEKAFMVIRLLCEGTGIRACERLTGLNRRTVLAVLETAGKKCARLLDTKLRNLKAEHIEVDELWSFVFCKQRKTTPFSPHGDQYTFLGTDRVSKLIISWLVGKRTQWNAQHFMLDLKSRLANRVQLTTDGFRPYYDGQYGAVPLAFGQGIDYATETKEFGAEADGERRYSPAECVSVRRVARIGNPNRNMICNNHVERTNLSARIFNRRFTRLTLGYSKKLENHTHAVALFVAHFNFCRKHSAHGQTPAMAARLTDHVWTVNELLQSPSSP